MFTDRVFSDASRASSARIRRRASPRAYASRPSKAAAAGAILGDIALCVALILKKGRWALRKSLDESDRPPITVVQAVDVDRPMKSAPERSITDTRELTNDWYVRLGLSRSRREESASDELRTRGDRERKQETAARLRWPGIVAAIGSVTRRYNAGAGHEVLSVIDDADGESRGLVVTIIAPGGHTLRVAVHGAELCVRPTPSTVGAADDGQRWTTFGATDEAIAAYALQDWLTHL